MTRKKKSALSVQTGGSHYKDLTIQPAEYCQLNKINALESAVIKYVTRHQDKNGEEDIQKAIHCLGLWIELEYSS